MEKLPPLPPPPLPKWPLPKWPTTNILLNPPPTPPEQLGFVYGRGIGSVGDDGAVPTTDVLVIWGVDFHQIFPAESKLTKKLEIR